MQQITIRNVALASGLSKGGLSHYYDSKKALLLDAFNYYFEGVVEECTRVSEMQGTSFEKLIAFDIIFDLQHPKLKLTHPILYDFMAEAIHNQTYRTIYDDWVEKWVQMVKRLLEAGIDDGSIISCEVEAKAHRDYEIDLRPSLYSLHCDLVYAIKSIFKKHRNNLVMGCCLAGIIPAKVSCYLHNTVIESYKSCSAL